MKLNFSLDVVVNDEYPQQQTKNLIPYESKTGGYFIAIKKLRNKL